MEHNKQSTLNDTAPQMSEGTLAVRGLVHPPMPVDALAMPIYTSTTFRLSSAQHGATLSASGHGLDGFGVEGESKYLYSRWANPTSDAAADLINALEHGVQAYVFASGMAAVSTAVWSVLKAGDHCVVQTPIYGGSHEVFDWLQTFGVQVTRVPLALDGNADAFATAVKENTKLIYCESPANPICGVVDLHAIAKLAKEKNLISIIDSTFASPINQQPIKIGFSMVVHSCTKYIGGHSDVTAGAIVCADKELAKKVWQAKKLFGGILSPYEAFLIIRGIKTLKLRVEAQNANALHLAQWLETHPEVACVHYPGLASHPAHKVAAAQMTGFGGVLAFELKKGATAGKTLVESVKVINHAVSLGGVESLITHPMSTTHVMVPEEVREAAGITSGLIRLSIGIEDKLDLEKDLEQALKQLQ